MIPWLVFRESLWSFSLIEQALELTVLLWYGLNDCFGELNDAGEYSRSLSFHFLLHILHRDVLNGVSMVGLRFVLHLWSSFIPIGVSETDSLIPVIIICGREVSFMRVTGAVALLGVNFLCIPDDSGIMGAKPW